MKHRIGALLRRPPLGAPGVGRPKAVRKESHSKTNDEERSLFTPAMIKGQRSLLNTVAKIVGRAPLVPEKNRGGCSSPQGARDAFHKEQPLSHEAAAHQNEGRVDGAPFTGACRCVKIRNSRAGHSFQSPAISTQKNHSGIHATKTSEDEVSFAGTCLPPRLKVAHASHRDHSVPEKALAFQRRDSDGHDSHPLVKNRHRGFRREDLLCVQLPPVDQPEMWRKAAKRHRSSLDELHVPHRSCVHIGGSWHFGADQPQRGRTMFLCHQGWWPTELGVTVIDGQCHCGTTSH